MVKNSNTSDNLLRWLLLGGELLVLNAALLTMAYIYTHLTGSVTPHYKRLLLLMSLVYIACETQGYFSIIDRFARGEQLLRQFLQHILTFTAFSLLVLWVFRWPLMTWQFMLPFYSFIILFVGCYRWLMRQAIKSYRSKGGNMMSVIFIGNIRICSSLYSAMLDDKSTGYNVLGYFADEPSTKAAAHQYLGTLEEAAGFIQTHMLHNVFCILPSSQRAQIKDIMQTCDQHLVHFCYIPDTFNYQHRTMAFRLMAGTPVFNLRYEPLASTGNRTLKRTCDILMSSLFLFTAFPIIYIVFGLLIKLSSAGPILFKQKRSGLDGKEFYLYKFRSMRVNADSDAVQATKDDARKTKIGEFMRHTSIDELPQFINVLKGDMSVVGPRPHMLKHTAEYSQLITNYMVRHFAKPGITGYAQVTGFRGETQELWQMEGRIEKDIWYIEHWSLALDIFIIWKTISNAIKGESNAY